MDSAYLLSISVVFLNFIYTVCKGLEITQYYALLIIATDLEINLCFFKLLLNAKVKERLSL